MKRYAMLAMLAVLAACASGGGTWQKPGADQSALERDRSECLAVATAAHAHDPMTGAYPGYAGWNRTPELEHNARIEDDTNECLRQRGWHNG